MQATAHTYSFEPRIKSSKNQFRTGLPTVDQLNLDRLIIKASHPETKLGWSVDEAAEFANLYRVFLFLCATYPDDVIVPPREVDEIWHLHILDTRNYAKDCSEIFGSYLHHFPYAGMTESSKAFETAAIAHTITLVERHFPDLLEEL